MNSTALHVSDNLRGFADEMGAASLLDLTEPWQLVASSEGLSRWFAEATVIPGPSGSVTLRFAPGAEGTRPIVIWDPPLRIRFGAADGSPGAHMTSALTRAPVAGPSSG
jgi:hypothetical protein